MDPELIREFPLEERVVFLNHAAVGPMPRRAGRAVQRLMADSAHAGTLNYARWLASEGRLREQFAALIHAPAGADIALLKNTSEALSVIAQGFPWRRGDNVVTGDEEFPSNRIVWEALWERGVSLKTAALGRGRSAEDALFDQVDSRTRVISVSSVQYGTGRRMDLSRIGDFCAARGIALCVDAIQSLGAIPFDAQAIGADFVCADAHKWMLGPEGVALFYCRARWRERLKLFQHGWAMVDDPWNFDQRNASPARTAKRFECGTLNRLGIEAAAASLSLLFEIGIQEVETKILQRVERLFEGLGRIEGVEIVTPQRPGSYAGIVTFRVGNGDMNSLFRTLESKNVLCAERGGGIRFSPHCYTRFENLDKALAIVREWVLTG